MKHTTAIAKQLAGLLDLLLPPRCVLCGLASNSTCLCQPCKSELPWPAHQCRSCGLPLPLVTDIHCGACITRRPAFTSVVCPLWYEFPADRLVQAFKFRKQHAAGRVLARLMSEKARSASVTRPDLLVPVPLHGIRMMRRGFNQAFELASYLGRSLGIEVNAHALGRQRHTLAQSGLSRKQRRKNLRDAFYWRGLQRPARHIALVDDVMTTGTTVTECTRVLLKAGAVRVDVWVAARAVPGAGK